MHRLLAFLFVAIAAGAQSLSPEQTAELARATKNPFDLARFLDAHPAAFWDVEWKSLHDPLAVKLFRELDGGWPRCATEVLSVSIPEQAIVIIECNMSPGDQYIRYTRQPDGTWRCEGAQLFEIRNYPRRHEIDRTAGRPFLRVSSEGSRGSGLGEEFERWFDLSHPGFEPVFGFPVQGFESRMGFGISRTISAHVRTGKGSLSADLQVEFTGQGEDGEIDLGSVSPTATYFRNGNSGEFKCSSASLDMLKKTMMSCAEFQSLANLGEDSPTEETLIRFALPKLKEIASGGDGREKRWLKEYLTRVKDIREVRELRTMLR